LAPWRRRRLVVFLVSLLAAGAAGVGLGLWHQKGRSPADDEEALAEPAPFPEATPPLKREQARQRNFDEFFDQNDGRENRPLGVQLCLAVALPYLEEGRLGRADELFARLER